MANGQELVHRDLTEEALVAKAKADIQVSAEDLVIPMVKVAQGLTREVQDGDAEAGELIHSLTGESYGESVQLLIVDSFKGRSWRNPEDRTFHTAGKGETVVQWEDHPCHGQLFVDCLDAEEQYRARVRNNEIDWGKGPGISTTYNFVGLVVRDDGTVDDFPVRVSLQRSSAKAGRNWVTMLNIARAPWDAVYELTTSKTRSKGGEPYVAVSVKLARKATDDERQAAVRIAQAIHGGANVEYVGEQDEEGHIAPTPEPEGTGLAM